MKLAAVGKLSLALLFFSTLMVVGCQALVRKVLFYTTKFVLLPSGHNDWASEPAVVIRNP